MPAFALGSRLGSYRLGRRMAADATGQLFEAHDMRLNREVAVRMLVANATSDMDRLTRFAQEARTTALLNHPNIAAVYDVGSFDGVPFVVSELLMGETLRARLDRWALPPPAAVHYALDVARGLVAAHDLGIVHRDLRPEHLFITREGQVKILDFGLASCRDEVLGFPTVDGAAAHAGVAAAAVGYLSPEQVLGQRTDARSDIFSLGVILYEMVSGVAPFHADSVVESLYAILKSEPPVLFSEDAAMPDELEPVVRHCLEKSPEARFQTARDLVSSLQSVLRSESPALWRSAKRTSRRPPKTGLVAALLRMM